MFQRTRLNMGIAGIGGQAKIALSKLSRQSKIPNGLCAKMFAVVILGLCFIFVWSFFSSTPEKLTSQRESFSDIAEPAVKSPDSVISKVSHHHSTTQVHNHGQSSHKQHGKDSKNVNLKKEKKRFSKVNVNETGGVSEHEETVEEVGERDDDNGRSENDEGGDEGGDVVVDGKEEGLLGRQDDRESGVEEGKDPDFEDGVDVEVAENVEEENENVEGNSKKNRKNSGPLFDPKVTYTWKLCSVRSKQNYIPCIDFESGTGKILRYRHLERSCPRNPPMCLVSLPPNGYETPVPWPQSKVKILYKNVAHPKLDAYIKAETWVLQSGEYLEFNQSQSDVINGVSHYLQSMEEMVPDIEWGKNIRVVLDIGVTDSRFAEILFEKNVITLSLGLKDDLVNLAQLAIERGFPAIISPFSTRRLPFPSAIFDAVHCSGCNVHWHSNGGRKLLEMNRVLRPGGYFILSAKHKSIEEEEAMSSLTASICWNPLADKVDEYTDVGVKIYQKPESNVIYELRRKKNPPLCEGNENQDAAWKVPIRNCLHNVPTAMEQHGSEWPAEWPNRLESYPDWLTDKEQVTADTHRWKSIVEKSYLTGMGINWTNIRNVMDMKAIYGGFAAALSTQNIWVMNVVPVHAPNTLPYIYDRGLFGVYHDWCESFGTYPRSYDLLHADHLFSRLKSRCDQPVAIIVEMDRILRPGGWAILRDKVVILDPLEGIFRSLNWEIRMTFAKEKEGILVVQKTIWRP